MTHSQAQPHRIDSRWSKTSMAFVVALLAACGGDGAPESAATSGEPSSPATRVTAVMELGEELYTFERVTCDLDDTIDDDVLVRAGGTAPDGRRMTLEVERREVGDMLHDRVTLSFDSMMEEDRWNAYVSGRPGGTWTTLVDRETLDGPLVVVENGQLTAEGIFTHETGDATRPGVVRVRCEE